jgi:hypothetical protein
MGHKANHLLDRLLGRKLENMQASYTEFFKAALYKKVSLGRMTSPDHARWKAFWNTKPKLWNGRPVSPATPISPSACHEPFSSARRPAPAHH